MKRPFYLASLSLLVILVSAVTACSAATPPGVPSSTSGLVSQSPAAPTISASPAQTSAPAVSPAATTFAAKGSSTPVSPAIPFPKSEGLDQLNGYTLSLRISFKGTRDGRTQDTTDLYTRTFSLDPAAQFTAIQTTDDSGNLTSILQGRVGSVQYVRAGPDEPCTASMVASTQRPILNPAALLTPILRGKDIGTETVNGVPTRHYVGDTLQDANTQVSGQVWIADPGAFVVKYSATVKGGEAYFGKGNQGEQAMALEITDVGAKKPVAIPAGCLPPVTDLPAMADAANLTRSLSQLSYTTASGMTKTAEFYQVQMKALGWTLESSSASPDSSQPPAGASSIPNIPNIPQLPNVPGVDLGQFLPTRAPASTLASPGLQNSWMVFALAKDRRHAYITLRPEGSSLRVQVQIVQD